MHLAIASAVACTTAISWSAAEPTTAWPQVVRDGDPERLQVRPRADARMQQQRG